MKHLAYLALGTAFGVILSKSEAVSWFRIQEMFRFQSFHMYGLLLSAVAVATVSLQLLKRVHARSLGGQPIAMARRPYQHGVVLGGLLFGMGWALTGACPGPLYVLVGSGLTVMLVAIASAMLGVWAYAALHGKLPH
ncbi:MAG: DUF6691 family protein [Planctomycetota bacterium]